MAIGCTKITMKGAIVPKVCSSSNTDIDHPDILVNAKPLIYSPLSLHPCWTPQNIQHIKFRSNWLNVCYYCSTGWVTSFSLCDSGSCGNCHPLYVSEELSVCWSRAFTEQPAHSNRIGWAQVIPLFPQRKINWYPHLWTLVILYDACVLPRHFTCGNKLHFVSPGQWYGGQKGVLETREHVPFTGSYS